MVLGGDMVTSDFYSQRVGRVTHLQVGVHAFEESCPSALPYMCSCGDTTR